MQVKFRGKRFDGQGWVEGNLIIADSISCKDYYIRLQSWDDVHGYLTYPVIPESVGMFTGLTDKNGKEIYVAVGENGGDILKTKHGGTFKVEYFDGFCGEIFLGWDSKELEIIGNAFDNHELLEK